jgi:hypothetical protein
MRPANPVLRRATTAALALLGGAFAACVRRTPPLLPPSDPIVPGAEWLDTEGRRIEAHGGGILRVGRAFWWYGEDHRLGGGNRTGIAAYSSADLRHWKPEGIVLPKDSLPELFRDRGVAERPKVIRNPRTGKYVMWMHLDANRYQEASAGVAVADAPGGASASCASSAPSRTTTATRARRAP